MKAFLEHNKVSLLNVISSSFMFFAKIGRRIKLLLYLQFGNLPYGFRANTWVVPPIVAGSPFTFPPLPIEDETWGGNGGGQGRDGKHDRRRWAKDFATLAAMPCKTAEERQIRDRKAFLVHNLFVDVSVSKAVDAIQRIIGSRSPSNESQNGHIDTSIFEEQIGDLKIRVSKDDPCGTKKLVTKIDASQSSEISYEELAQRNLIKGITADESVTVHVSYSFINF